MILIQRLPRHSPMGKQEASAERKGRCRNSFADGLAPWTAPRQSSLVSMATSARRHMLVSILRLLIELMACVRESVTWHGVACEYFQVSACVRLAQRMPTTLVSLAGSTSSFPFFSTSSSTSSISSSFCC